MRGRMFRCSAMASSSSLVFNHFYNSQLETDVESFAFTTHGLSSGINGWISHLSRCSGKVGHNQPERMLYWVTMAKVLKHVGGVLQGSCRVSRVFYAAIFSAGCSLSGLSVTAPTPSYPPKKQPVLLALIRLPFVKPVTMSCIKSQAYYHWPVWSITTVSKVG